jgi:chorismate dehydratase
MLRIGRIDYANCTPLFMQLESSLPPDSTEIVRGVPATLNSSLAKGEIDICISSSIEFTRHSDEYSILPGNCIGSDGSVRSVLFFSSRPVEELSGQQFLVTSESATSVILLQILLIKRWGLSDCSLNKTSLPWNEAMQQTNGLLLIGDNALKAASAAPTPYCYDLGKEWKELTGLPFVYALWLINRKSSKGKEEALTCLLAMIDQARENISSDADILALKAPESSWITPATLSDYWKNSITYNLDRRHLAGLQMFYQLAAELNLISDIPEPVFFPV